MSHSLVPSSPLGRFPGKFFGSTVNDKDFRDWCVYTNYTTPSPKRPASDSKADSDEEALLDGAETKGTPQMLRDLSKSLTKQYKALKSSQSPTSSSSSESSSPDLTARTPSPAKKAPITKAAVTKAKTPVTKAKTSVTKAKAKTPVTKTPIAKTKTPVTNGAADGRAKRIPFGLSFAASVPRQGKKPRCRECKKEIDYDEPRIRNRHLANKNHQYPQTDQYHCRPNCIRKGLSEDHYRKFMEKRWTDEIVQNVVTELGSQRR